MNRLYPVFLNLKNKDCLVFGGGKVAERKVRSLIKSKARITLIDPKASRDILALSKKHGFKIIKRNYRKKDIKGFFLIIAATDSEAVNGLIAKESAKYKIFCNVVDDPEKCDFFIPASFGVKDLKIAISTNGKSPALAKKLKNEIKNIISSEVPNLIDILAELKRNLKKKYPGARKKREEILKTIVDSRDALSITKEDIKKIKRRFKEWI